MQLENRFEVPLPPAAAWSLLMDVGSTISCFPGARLLARLDEDRYRGDVALKLGPFTMVFLGDVRVERRDPIARSGTVTATWTETDGLGEATTLTRFSMQDRGGSTTVWLHTHVQLASCVAQYGLGAGIVSTISAHLVAHFAENVRARLRGTSPTLWNDGYAPMRTAEPTAPISAGDMFFRVVSERVRRFLN